MVLLFCWIAKQWNVFFSIFEAMKRIILSICILFAAVPAAFADDGGAWLSLQVNKGWQKAYAFARLEHRSNNNFSSTEALFTSVGGGYKFTPWLKADLSYEFWDINPNLNFHKAVLCGTGTMVKDGLSVSLREKLEFAVNPANSSTSFTLRTRLRAQYNIPESIFRPYVMSEIFTWSSWIRSLHYVGAELAIDKHNLVDLFYMYHLPNGGQAVHLLGVGYYFSF